MAISFSSAAVGLFLLFIIQSCLSDLVELWSIEQLDDMVVSDAHGKSVPALAPTILALYETQCKDRLYNEIGFTDSRFPRGLHLQFATFDRLKAQSEPWYVWYPDIMDAFIRYNISIPNENEDNENENEDIDWCPTIIYQPANWSLPYQIFDKNGDQTFREWVWSMIEIKDMKFNNTLDDKAVKLLFRYMNPNNNDVEIINEQIIAEIPPNTVASIKNLHAGDILVAQTEDGETINRYVLDTLSNYIEITPTADPSVIDDSKFLSKYNDDYNLLLRRNWSTRRRYLNNIKAPPMMPRFTDLGFKHGKLPQEVCDYVLDFYNAQISRKRLESFPTDGTQINVREVPTYMMHIPGDKKHWIANIIKPLLEEWTGTKLKYSTMYGLREYTHGAVLKDHIDRIETHIISTIIHVKHFPNNVSWPLEVVSWDGERHYIEDSECDMVFYESSKLIHGRPMAYQGDSWINAFLHFRPSDWEGYTFTPQNVIKTPNGERPLVDFIYG